MLSHEQLVRALAKSGKAISDEMSGLEAHMVHMVLGISGEVGELIHHLDEYPFTSRDEIIEEAGDIEFYLEGYRQGLVKLGRDIYLEHDCCIGGSVMDIAMGLIRYSSYLTEDTKKYAIYHKELSHNVDSKLQVMHDYLGTLYSRMGVTRTWVLDVNIEKLTKRYGETYSDKAAIERVDVIHPPTQEEIAAMPISNSK